MNNLDVEQLKTFLTVIDEGTFDAAAEKLFVTPSAISQRIKALETIVGRILLQRTKPILPTESGKELLLLAREIVLLMNDFEDRLEPSLQAVNQTIPIAVNADSLGTWMVPALALASEFANFEIRREDEEYSVELLRDGTVMAAITSSSKTIQGCKTKKLGTMRYRPMATKLFVKKWFRNGFTSQAFASAPVISFDKKDEYQNRLIKKYVKGTQRPPCHYIPATFDFAIAVSQSMGWGYISDLQYETLAKKSSLVEISPGASIDVTLYIQYWKLSSVTLNNAISTICEYAKYNLH